MTMALGTPAWCAPEVVNHDTYDEMAADVCAFGMTMWEVLTGSEPFGDIPVFAVLLQTTEQDARPPLPAESVWPVKVAALVPACWARAPSERPTMVSLATPLNERAEWY